MSAALVGVDTNILIRLLARDDEKQFAACIALLRRSAETGPLFVNPLVATETVWILERRFGQRDAQARKQVGELVGAAEFFMPDRLDCGDWTGWFEQRHSGFFDVVIAATNAASGCSRTYTFDKRAAKAVPGMELLS